MVKNGNKNPKSRPKNVLISAGVSNHVIRRSITVEDSLNTFINTLRARFLEHEGKEIDFTTMINAMAAVTANRISREEMTEKDWETFNIYASFNDLHLEGAKDEWENKWLEYELPKFKLQPRKSNSNSVKGKKSQSDLQQN